jgi:hypothetical protein
MKTRRACVLAAPALLLGAGLQSRALAQPAQPQMPIFDAHVHYSHDAVLQVPPAQAVQLLREAGLKGVLVSSSDDEGTQRLLQAAPDLIVPELRPYRTRADVSTWARDEGTIKYLEARMARNRYVGIGEFHLFGADADLPVPRRMVALAKERNYLLHAHSDADAVQRLLKQWPQARVLWAHSGFETPAAIAEQLRRHPGLWCDLAYRSDHASGGVLDSAWRSLFEAFPDRFMLGSDTFTPERWHFIGPHARSARQWLAGLPTTLAEAVAWRNAETLLKAQAPR